MPLNGNIDERLSRDTMPPRVKSASGDRAQATRRPLKGWPQKQPRLGHSIHCPGPLFLDSFPFPFRDMINALYSPIFPPPKTRFAFPWRTRPVQLRSSFSEEHAKAAERQPLCAICCVRAAAAAAGASSSSSNGVLGLPRLPRAEEHNHRWQSQNI